MALKRGVRQELCPGETFISLDLFPPKPSLLQPLIPIRICLVKSRIWRCWLISNAFLLGVAHAINTDFHPWKVESKIFKPTLC